MAIEPTGERMSGVAVAVVTDNEDPRRIGRVRIEYPWDDGGYWARTATPMAGDGYGTYFLPEVDDQVLVAFEDGDINRPYVIGALWSDNNRPPVDTNGDNDLREIRSRSGHRVTFDDSDTEGKVEIETNAGHRVVLDDSPGSESVRVEDKSGHNNIEMDSTSGEVAIEARRKLSLSAPTVEVDAGSEVSVSTAGDVYLSSGNLTEVDATGPLTIKGAVIRLN